MSDVFSLGLEFSYHERHTGRKVIRAPYLCSLIKMIVNTSGLDYRRACSGSVYVRCYQEEPMGGHCVVEWDEDD